MAVLYDDLLTDYPTVGVTLFTPANVILFFLKSFCIWLHSCNKLDDYILYKSLKWFIISTFMLYFSADRGIYCSKFEVSKIFYFILRKLIHLFSRAKWLVSKHPKVVILPFIMLQKISISNNYCSFEFALIKES